jgi:glycosyltransferase involved in cell wall biosynthesis
MSSNLTDEKLPLVSVGVPAYNRPVELKRVLGQLVNQTYKNIEIIVLDDCSTLPEVAQVVQEYIAQYPNVTYFRNAENLGVLRNAAELRKYAHGQYFCWVSDDDWRAPEFVEILVTELEKNRAVDFTFCDYYEVYADGSRAPGYPLSHLKVFQAFQNRSRLIRTLNFYWQSGARGKCNLLYALFRKTAIDVLDLEKISGGYRHLNMDCLLAFTLLQAGPLAVCREVLCTLTCGNKKHYASDAEQQAKPVLSRFIAFWLGGKKDRDLYIDNTDLWIEKLAIYLLFIPKLAATLAAYIFNKMPSRFRPKQAALRLHPIGITPASVKKIKLPNVTLVAMATRNVEETLQALIYSCQGVEFGSVKLLSHYTPFGLDKDITFCRIDKIKDIDEWSYKIVYELNNYIETDFALLVHADGFVVNPSAWRDEFLNCDYIGAPWPLPKDEFSYRDINGNIFRVGNSVSLRSKRLLELPIKLNLPWEPYHGFYNEDGFICGKNRHIYEANGMQFAPLDVAKYFSHETMIPEVRGIKPFAFHKWAGSNRAYPKF